MAENNVWDRLNHHETRLTNHDGQLLELTNRIDQRQAVRERLYQTGIATTTEGTGTKEGITLATALTAASIGITAFVGVGGMLFAALNWLAHK